MRNWKKYLTAFLLVMFACGCVAVYADGDNKTVVRVGFPIQPGVSYIDERGDYAGYLVDYLNQLTLFTNWEIEYVQVEGDLDTQLSTLMDMLERGQLDMMGTMNRDPQLEKLFLYPSYSYGTTYIALAVKEGDARWIEEDFSNWDGIKVAVCPGYSDRIEQFQYYALVNDFTYETVECETYEEMVEAAKSGRADAMIQADISMTDGFRMIGRFAPMPYYFALFREDTDLLQQLNAAMTNLQLSQPNLQNELYNLYFKHPQGFTVSEEQRAFIQTMEPVRVLFAEGNAPFQYVKDGELTGFAVKYLDKFAELTGLRYEPVVVSTAEEALALIQQGEVDLIGCVATNSPLASMENVHFTVPFFNSFSVTACADPVPHTAPSELEFRTNTQLALEEIQSNDDYAARMDYYSLTYYLRKAGAYDGVVVDWANTQNFSYAVGVTDNVPSELVTLLNLYASSMSEETRQAMLYQYSSDKVEYSFLEMLAANREAIIGASVVVVLLLCIIAIYHRSRRIAHHALLTENRLMHLAMYDDMTGAYNESHFRTLLDEACSGKKSIALVAFNIRGFKYINDMFSTKRADEMLCEIKVILDAEMREGEFFCRQTADLFYLALQEQDDQTLLCRLSGLFGAIGNKAAQMLDGQPLSIYCGAVFLSHSPTPYSSSANMNFLMAALAFAKQSNCQPAYIYDESLHRKEQLHYYIETHMQSALEQEEYQLYLQPKMNLQTGCVDGAEALVRWQTKDRGMIFPDQFIPYFEENGFCGRLDIYMVEQACKKLRTWMDAGIQPIVISVNQSKSLFIKEDYVEKLLEITDKYQVSPKYIILEILEGLAFENIDTLNRTIRRLNDVGFRVSMDDFGSGYSSLNTLGKLQINELKLDRLFLKDVVNDQNGSQRNVLASIFELAKKLGIQTVAEGVETQESEDMVRAMACDYGQGYYYSKPIPAEEFQKIFLQFYANVKEKA